MQVAAVLCERPPADRNDEAALLAARKANLEADIVDAPRPSPCTRTTWQLLALFLAFLGSHPHKKGYFTFELLMSQSVCVRVRRGKTDCSTQPKRGNICTFVFAY